MKFKYCKKCDKSFFKSMMEKDNCIDCNGPCEVRDIKPHPYFMIGQAIGFAGLIVIILLYERLIYVQRFIIAIGTVVSAFYFIMAGMKKMKEDIRTKVLKSEKDQG